MRLNSCGVMYQARRECYSTGKCYKSVATFKLLTGNQLTKNFSDILRKMESSLPCSKEYDIAIDKDKTGKAVRVLN
jgi:hypothetical protein